MTPYAEGTTVSPEASQAEIARLVVRFGAQGYTYGWEDDGPRQRAAIGFKAHGRVYRMRVTMPTLDEFAITPGNVRRKPDAMVRARDAEVRRRWRALALTIKAKLEAVETGIATWEDEFLAYTVMPDGGTVSDHVQPMIAAAYESGQMPTTLLQIGRR